jgi:phosphoribosylanthranilate isomerase
MPDQKPFILKVCGMRDPENIRVLGELRPDLMGFIFYPGSRRYAGKELDASVLKALPAGIQKVGVFVDADPEEVLQKALEYSLDFVQLHGGESPAYCSRLKGKLKIIKAFGLDTGFDFGSLKEYVPYVNYFLFDTRTEAHGGSGQTFDWDLLKSYREETPFFLSGGIGPEEMKSASEIRQLFPALLGLDVNSRFETAPGMKDIESLKKSMNTFHK